MGFRHTFAGNTSKIEKGVFRRGTLFFMVWRVKLDRGGGEKSKTGDDGIDMAEAGERSSRAVHGGIGGR